MTRVYLEEDVALIRKYFPGAKAIALNTPFDLSRLENPWALRADDCGELPEPKWQSDVFWSHEICGSTAGRKLYCMETNI